MTDEPQIRFPNAASPDDEGWWPAAKCDTPGGLGDVSALPRLKDAGITHPPSAKHQRPNVSILKHDRVAVTDAPSRDPDASPIAGDTDEAVMETEHPPMMVTPATNGHGNGDTATDAAVLSAEPEADDPFEVLEAFSEEESAAILRTPTPTTPSKGETKQADSKSLPANSQEPQQGSEGTSDGSHQEEDQADRKGQPPHHEPQHHVPQDREPQDREPQDREPQGCVPLGVGTPPPPAQSEPTAPPTPASQAGPAPKASAPPAPMPMATREAASGTPQRPPANPPVQARPAVSAPTMPKTPPSRSIPADDTDSFIVESFTEDFTDQPVAPTGAPTAPARRRRWGRSVEEKHQQAIDRNLANTHAPLDVLFAQSRQERPRLMALRPSIGRDLLVWIIAIVAVGQLLLRGWEILPTLNTFDANNSAIQLQAAISMMIGGALGAVCAIVAVRFITGMRATLPWIIGVILVFGVFPWYGFGSQLAPTGMPPLPNPIDVVFNPVFDKSGTLGLALIGLAICALIAMFTAVMVGSNRRN